MEIKDLILRTLNFTVVFPHLDKDSIRRDIIKKNLNGYKIMIADIPEVLVIDFEERKAQANFSSKRMSINVHVRSVEELGEAGNFLSTVNNSLLMAIPEEDHAKIRGFGYNISGFIQHDKLDYNEYLMEAFFDGAGNISKIIKEKVIGISPGYSFEKDEAIFNISLTPRNREGGFFRLYFHCNIHFEELDLLENRELSEELVRYFGYFKETLGKL